jgi:hypothetical protein
MWIILHDEMPHTVYKSLTGVHAVVQFKTERQAKAFADRKNNVHATASKWRKIWTAAFYNMPVRIKHETTKRWDPLAEKLPVPEYIKGTVGKKPKYQLIDGQVHQLILITKKYEYGKSACLARLLGYNIKKKATGRIVPAGLTIYGAIIRGSKPKDPDRRQLLIRLANKKTGPRLARNLLRQQGILHRYINDARA